MKPGNHIYRKDNMPNLMHQLDLSTGYHTVHRIDTFSRPLVDHYRMLLPYGGIVPVFEGQFNVRIKGPRFTLFFKNMPIEEAGVGNGCDSTWAEMVGVIKDLDWTLETKPRDGLWVAEVPLESIYRLKEEPVNWVFDFVRHLAAAMVISDSNRPV